MATCTFAMCVCFLNSVSLVADHADGGADAAVRASASVCIWLVMALQAAAAHALTVPVLVRVFVYPVKGVLHFKA